MQSVASGCIWDCIEFYSASRGAYIAIECQRRLLFTTEITVVRFHQLQPKKQRKKEIRKVCKILLTIHNVLYRI